MRTTIHLSGFPTGVTAEEVKNFLERLTCIGSIYALKVRKPQQAGPRDFAIVQFTAERYASAIMRLTQDRGLLYGKSYLTSYEVEQDIVPKPRVPLPNFSALQMHFGCQVSPNDFLVLWKTQNVRVSYGTGVVQKLYFSMYCNHKYYRLELPCENVGKTVLHSGQGRSPPKYLVIQLSGAPKISVKEDQQQFESMDYYSNESDENWIRTTDFTPSSCIGQSSALCLELPDSHLNVPFSNFPNYKGHGDSPFIIQRGSSYSSTAARNLVPVVEPPLEFSLSFDVLFKLNRLVQNAYIPGPALNRDFYKLLSRYEKAFLDYSLQKLFHRKECCYEPAAWLHKERQKWNSNKAPLSPSLSLADGPVSVYRVLVTPARVYFSGPELTDSNRVLRNFSRHIDNFLKISFVDEDLKKLRSMDLSPRSSTQRRTTLYKRICDVLVAGIVIGGKKFEFLAYSSSQLRENTAWMFANKGNITAASIRDWMGDFGQIKNVAKYAARLGQSFSSSRQTLKVRMDEIEVIPDVEVDYPFFGTHYVFSDGIGKISAKFAKEVAKKCDLPPQFTPSAFQIRYGGYKGVVAVDPTSSKKLSLRKSMHKFESANIHLDVLAWSKYQPCYLNRQIITLLSTLGVPDEVFEKKQREIVDRLDLILTDPQEALGLMAPGENKDIIQGLISCGYKPNAEPFLSLMLENFRASKLLEIRTKTRIFVSQGRSMMGCLDETETLQYGQVVVQCTSPMNPEERVFITGTVVVAKNPCLHPGDIRILHAIHVKDLDHLVDCIVFPQRGTRPHPNECSGSDLDGDIYFVCWDPELIPPNISAQPMDYNPEPAQILDHDVTTQEIVEYFANYIVNDSLGVIANAHTVFADKEPLKAFSEPCLELAEKFSTAVDFPKTGVPAEIPQHLYVKEYPDFMEKLDKPRYESENVIGKLFREVKERAPLMSSIKSFTYDVAIKSYDKDMEVDGFRSYIKDAFNHKEKYDYKLGNIMASYGIKTEAEILGGGTKGQDAESMGRAVRSLRKEALSWFNANEGFDESAKAKASAWYYVTYHPSYWENSDHHFLSFAWCVYGKLVEIKKEAEIKKSVEQTNESESSANILKLETHELERSVEQTKTTESESSGKEMEQTKTTEGESSGKEMEQKQRPKLGRGQIGQINKIISQKNTGKR